MKTQNLKVSPELEDLSVQIGEFMEYWGFKKVHGQSWCHLYLSKKPLDAAELMGRLGISKALVSISLKELLNYGVIDDLGKGDRGTRCYLAKEDLLTPILETLRRREQRIISRVRGAHSLLSRLENHDLDEMRLETKKLENLGQLIKMADAGLESIIKRKWFGLPEFVLIKGFLKSKLSYNQTTTERSEHQH